MANPDFLLEGQGALVDSIIDIDGAAALKAAGRTIIADGVGDPTAPALVEDATLLAGHGSIAVAAGPTSTALRGSATPCVRVTVKAWVTNDDTLYVGGATVTAGTNNTTGGFQLSPGESVTFGVDDIANVYIHGTAAEGASFFYET
jgi:hypothetical protein